MEQISNEIRIGYSDPDVNALLDGIGDEQRPFSRHFSHNEDFFLELQDEFTVSPIPIHHDVRLAEPGPAYRSTLKEVVAQIARAAPQVLKDLAYFFDPAEILRPCFYKVYQVDDNYYLYLLRIDLIMRAGEATAFEKGTNDLTPRYRTKRLFLEPTVIPLEGAVQVDGQVRSCRIRQTISQTWIGEFGRGYFQQGIWMDADLTKFFSRLFLPSGKRIYPYYPYLCKYKTVCEAVIGLSPEKRLASVPWLHRSLVFLLPAMERIQAEMKSMNFSEDLDFFRELKGKVPTSWYEVWHDLRVESYLNAAEMKEFRIED